MRVIWSISLGAMVGFVGGGTLVSAQSAGLGGVVTDSSGRGLEGVELQLRGVPRTVRTGPDGEFRFDRVKGTRFWLVARRAGFQSAQLDGRPQRQDAGQVRLTMAALSPEALPVANPIQEKIQDYVWQSRASNRGRFLSGQDAFKLWSTEISGAFETVVAAVPPAQTPLAYSALGATPQQTSGGAPPPTPGAGAPPSSPEPTPSWYYTPAPPQNLEISSATSHRCSPLILLNGRDESGTVSLSDVAPSDAQAVEMYSGFQAPLVGSLESLVSVRARCGVVVVWLRP